MWKILLHDANKIDITKEKSNEINIWKLMIHEIKNQLIMQICIVQFKCNINLLQKSFYIHKNIGS